MIDLAHFWRVPAYLPYLQPVLTPEMIAEAEELLGVKLPRPYLDLLRAQNGGYVRYTYPDTAHSLLWGIGPHFPNITRYQDWRVEGEEADELEGEVWIPRQALGLVPFDGDGHWFLCFDYRVTGPTQEPRISIIDMELEEDREIAASFSEFLTMLREEFTWPTLGILEFPLDTVAEKLEQVLRVKFSPPDSFDHGYPLRRAELKGGSDREWVWIHPNHVPRGFARPSEARYAELANLLPGTALRFAHLPEVQVILTCTSGVFDQIKDACMRASLKTVTIHE